jgi:hypothetical protein
MCIKKFFPLFFLLALVKISLAQAPVAVREEPRHHVAFQNQYLRLLDVWVPAGDTTFFHIHQIPSLFLILSKTMTASQVKGENWVQGSFTSEPGHAWYNDFKNGPLIHRVGNIDTIPFHVMDIEILSNSNKNADQISPLPFDTLFTSEKAFAYHVDLSNREDKKFIEDRGPMMAIVVSGPGLIVQDQKDKTQQEVLPGKFLWLEPGTNYSLQNKGADKTSAVIFELK